MRSNFKRFNMINLKDKINKAATFRELKQIAENRYEQSWQPELQKDAFIDGAEALLKLLRIGDVVGQSEQCTHENEVQRQGDGFIYTVCGDCGEDLD